MKERLRIAIYSGEIPSTTFIERLIKGVAHSGHKVLLYGAVKENITYRKNISIYGYHENKFSKLYSLLKYGTLLFVFKHKKKRQLDQYLKSNQKLDVYSKVKFYPVLWSQPDIFHVQWAKSLRDWMWVQDFGIRIVLSLRGAHINYSPIADKELAMMYRKYFPKINGFHAVSSHIAKEAEKYAAPNQRIQVVYSGLPLNNKPSLKTTLNTPLRLLSVGRPHWKKGYSYALDACKILKLSGFSFTYTIIGGADSMELLYQVNDLELQDVVRLVGQRTYDDVQNEMIKADILLLSSVEEGIANVVLEAMSLGTLVISTRCGGMEEVIVDGVNGFLVNIRDAEAIAVAVNLIGNMPLNALYKIREQAQNTILEKHLETHMVDGMLKLYSSVMTTEVMETPKLN